MCACERARELARVILQRFLRMQPCARARAGHFCDLPRSFLRPFLACERSDRRKCDGRWRLDRQ
eukprot:4441151-Pleurochrysis_carterae.AAC.1